MKIIIRKIAILVLCIALCVLPIRSLFYGYSSIYKLFFSLSTKTPTILFIPDYLIDTILALMSFCLLIIAVIDIIRSSRISKILFSVLVLTNIAVWLIRIFVPIQVNGSHRQSLLEAFEYSPAFWWLVLYFAMLIAILTLTIIPFIPPRRPTKTKQLEARIAELEQQVDELKKGE